MHHTEDRCGSNTKDVFSNTWRALSHKANSVDIDGSDLSLGREVCLTESMSGKHGELLNSSEFAA